MKVSTNWLRIADNPILTEGINILDAFFPLRVVRWLLCDV